MVVAPLRFSWLPDGVRVNPLWSPGRSASKAARLVAGSLGPLLKLTAPRYNRSALAEMARAPVRARVRRKHFNDFIVVLIDMAIMDSRRLAKPHYPTSLSLKSYA